MPHDRAVIQSIYAAQVQTNQYSKQDSALSATSVNWPTILVVAGPRIEAPALADLVGALPQETVDTQWRRLTWPHWQVAEIRLTLPHLEARELLAVYRPRTDIEVLPVPARARRDGRRVFVSDVDSTLISQEVIELLAARAGSRDQVAQITERAMQGEIDFAESLRERVRTLAGLPIQVFEDVLADITFSAGAEELCRTVLARGDVFAAVSGGFSEVVSPLVSPLGVLDVQANQLMVVKGRLTGELNGPIVDRAAKAAALRRYAADYGVDMTHTVSIGDGANDLDMLDAADLGIAFSAKPIVQAQAQVALALNRLDVVLDIFGIRPDASVSFASRSDDLN